MACPYPVHAHLHWLGDDAASRGRNPDMVNEWTRADLPDFGAMGSVMARWKVSYGAVSDVLDAVVEHLNRARPKPARPITRDDLPEFRGLLHALTDNDPDAACIAERIGLERVLDAVVSHLNANGGLPAEDDRWHRAYAIVEAERDTARESLRRLRDETDFDLFTVFDQLKQCRGEREQMTRDRDEAVARAEAAEARTAHTVTREDVEKALRKAFTEDLGLARTTNAVCALFGVEAEPAVAPAVAAEARTTPAVTVEQRNAVADHLWNAMVGSAKSVVRDVVAQAFASAGIETGVEAEPADPVEQKAAELFGVAFPGEAFDQHPYVTQEPWLIAARHVLGQEASDE